MRNFQGKRQILVLSSAIASALPCAVRAEVPTRLEPLYAEAVLAYNSKDHEKSLALLDELLRKKPGLTEALELKALNLKAKRDDKASAVVYAELIKAQLADGKSEKEIAPYRFELGLIRFRRQDPVGARRELSSALAQGFNASACRFFLGLIDLRANALGSAEAHFKEVSVSGSAELRPAADFYLGQIYAKLGQPSGATQRFFAARSGAKDVMDDGGSEEEARKVAGQIREATDTALKPFDRSGFFGNFGMILGRDSNVLSVPSSAVSVDPSAPGDAAFKTTLAGGIGYMSSPLDAWQLVPSYRGVFNVTSSESTKGGEFFVNDASFYVTHNALARFSWGGKIEGIYTFQNGGESRFHFGSYSLAVPLGPYIRYEVSPKVLLGAELNVGPTHYFLDSDNAHELKRSGFDQSLRVSVRNDRGDRFWNPAFSLLLDKNDADGSEYKSRTVGFEVSDSMRLTDPLTLGLTLNASFPRYADRSEGPRQDRLYVADANVSYRYTPQYTFVGDVQATFNQSTVEALYQYKRFVVSLGISYTF